MSGSTIKMVMVTGLKHATLHSVCARRFKKYDVSPMACVVPSAMADIVSQLRKTKSDAIGVDIGTLTHGQAEDAKAIADASEYRCALFDSRRPIDANAEEQTRAVWEQFGSTVQSIRAGINRANGTSQSSAPKAPTFHRDDRRQAASMKGGDFEVAPGVAPARNALHKFPDHVAPAVQKKVPTQDEITASVIALFKSHHRQPPPVGVAQKLGLPLAGVQAAYRKLMGESKIEAEDSDAPDRWVWKTEEPVEAKAEVVDSRPEPGRDFAPAFDGDRREIDGWALVKLSGDTVPRILDTDLAERLEMPRARDIRPLIERHAEALRKIATLETRETVSRGRNQHGPTSAVIKSDVYYLTEEQAAYVASKSEMPKAVALTIAMARVFVAWGKGELPAKPGTLDEDLARFLAQRTEARLAEQDAASKARDEELARKQEEERIAREKAIAEERREREELSRKLERERLEAEKRAEKERAARERLECDLPKMIKREVDNRPPLQTPVQQPMSYGAVIGPERGEELNEDVRDAARFAVGRVVSVPPTDLGKKAAEIWIRSTIRGRVHTKAKIGQGSFVVAATMTATASCGRHRHDCVELVPMQPRTLPRARRATPSTACASPAARRVRQHERRQPARLRPRVGGDLAGWQPASHRTC